MINIINHLQKAVSGEALLAPGWDWIWGCSSREQCVYLMIMFSQLRRIQWGHIWETAALLLGLWGRRWAWNLLHTSLSVFPTHHTEITNLHVWMFKLSCLCFLLGAWARMEWPPYLNCVQVCVKNPPLVQKQVCRWSRLRGVWSSQWWCWRLSLWWPSAWGCSPLFPEADRHLLCFSLTVKWILPKLWKV